MPRRGGQPRCLLRRLGETKRTTMRNGRSRSTRDMHGGSRSRRAQVWRRRTLHPRGAAMERACGTDCTGARAWLADHAERDATARRRARNNQDVRSVARRHARDGKNGSRGNRHLDRRSEHAKLAAGARRFRSAHVCRSSSDSRERQARPARRRSRRAFFCLARPKGRNLLGGRCRAAGFGDCGFDRFRDRCSHSLRARREGAGHEGRQPHSARN